MVFILSETPAMASGAFIHFIHILTFCVCTVNKNSAAPKRIPRESTPTSKRRQLLPGTKY